MARLETETDPDRSTVYVLGELEPRELANFYADEILTVPSDPRSARVEVVGHGIGYWRAGCPRKTEMEIMYEGERILRLTFGVYAILGSRPAFRVRVTNWVEARGVVHYRTMMGFRDPLFTRLERLPPDDPVNVALREAVAVATIVDGATGAHRLAVRDFHTALLEPDVDAILYAYRAVEAIRQAIDPGPEKRAWRAMHEKLGTDKAMLDDLAKVATVIRHGAHDHRLAARARGGSDRVELLEVARDVVFRELECLAGRDLLAFDVD